MGLASIPRLLASLILCWTVVRSLRDKDSLREARCGMLTPDGCHQYKEMGNFDLVCNGISGSRSCDQICNHAKCKLSCTSQRGCKQKCIAGRCKSMKCNSNRCNQECLRGACGMQCKGDECNQRCDLSGCTMKCPAGVKTCIQKCSGGMCNMVCPPGVRTCKQSCLFAKCFMSCNAHKCKRTCLGGECVDTSASTQREETKRRVSTKCSYEEGSAFCYQKCVGRDCNLAAVQHKNNYLTQVCSGENCRLKCRNPSNCKQVCAGGQCKSIACSSEFCVQECIAGNCQMQCNAKECHQICRGGNCRMVCTGSVQRCYQTCTGGGCEIECNGIDCIPFCWGGDCAYIQHFQYMGKYVWKLRCYVETKDCRQTCHQHQVCAVTDYKIFHSMNQTCESGNCNMHCHTEKSCKQICNKGACKRMRCTTNDCVQVCQGSGCEMECNAKNCKQFCEKGGCKMTCTTNSLSCMQICNPIADDCKYGCFAKSCFVVLGDHVS